MKIAVLCATRRGLALLKEAAALCRGHELAVCTFRETPWEPPYLDEIRAEAERAPARFIERRAASPSAFHAALGDFAPNLILVSSWRYMLPPELFERPRLGAYVFHDSLLPKYRGFAPTVWAVFNGEAETGATLFRCAREVDYGPIVDQRVVSMGADEEIGAVLERVTGAYLALLRDNFARLIEGRAPEREQDHRAATYTCRLTPEDVRLDWAWPTAKLINWIRGYTRPYPGAYTHLDGRRLTVWRAKRLAAPPAYAGRVAGRVVQTLPGEGAVVLTGDGALLLTEVQIEGEGPRPACEVLKRSAATLGRD